MAKKCQSKKKERETRKCFKCDEGYIAKNCKRKQSMKKHRVQEELDNEDNDERSNNKKQGFGEDLK